MPSGIAGARDRQRAACVTDGHALESVRFAAGLAICERAGCAVTHRRGAVPAAGGPGLLAAPDRETPAELLARVARYLV
jgi:myo-inositol-1(or 4)-monophosphatase